MLLDDLPLKQWPGGIFTSIGHHLGFICEIIDSLKECSNVKNREPFLTVS